jgi:hypothetical protein
MHIGGVLAEQLGAVMHVQQCNSCVRQAAGGSMSGPTPMPCQPVQMSCNGQVCKGNPQFYLTLASVEMSTVCHLCGAHV